MSHFSAPNVFMNDLRSESVSVGIVTLVCAGAGTASGNSCRFARSVVFLRLRELVSLVVGTGVCSAVMSKGFAEEVI